MAKKLKAPNAQSMKPGKKFQYLDCPKDEDQCYYDLRLVDFKWIEDASKFAFEFEILDTDTKLKVGSTASTLLDPYQDFAETYFWKDVFALSITLKGKAISEKRIAKLLKVYSPKYLKSLDEDGMVEDLTARFADRINGEVKLTIERRENKYLKIKTYKTWEPLG